jgi:nitroreductase
MTDSHTRRDGAPLQSQFLGYPIANEDLDTIVRVARAACRDINTEAWSVHYIHSPLTRRITALQGTPAALIFTSVTPLLRYGWLEYGMFLQSLKLAAQPIGLTAVTLSEIDTSEAQLRELIRIPRSPLLLGAVAVGYLDPHTADDATIDRRRPVRVRYLS